MFLIAWFLTYLGVSRFLFVTVYYQSVNAGKWYVMSLIKMPLAVCLLMTFTKMFSMRVVVYVVILGLLSGYVIGCT